MSQSVLSMGFPKREAFCFLSVSSFFYRGANTVRLYNVNPQNDHKKFMEKALSLGLYVPGL